MWSTEKQKEQKEPEEEMKQTKGHNSLWENLWKDWSATIHFVIGRSGSLTIITACQQGEDGICFESECGWDCERSQDSWGASPDARRADGNLWMPFWSHKDKRHEVSRQFNQHTSLFIGFIKVCHLGHCQSLTGNMDSSEICSAAWWTDNKQMAWRDWLRP